MKRPAGEWRKKNGSWYRKAMRVKWERYICLKCFNCGQNFFTKHPKSTLCSKKCRATFYWKNVSIDKRIRVKRQVTTSGYIELYDPKNPMSDKHGRIAEHRLVMSKTIGRPLKSFEHVHHINRNRKDNRPENLILLSHADHNTIHKSDQSKKSKRNDDGKFL